MLRRQFKVNIFSPEYSAQNKYVFVLKANTFRKSVSVATVLCNRKEDSNTDAQKAQIISPMSYSHFIICPFCSRCKMLQMFGS